MIQGKEPVHLMSLFGPQPMVVYKGGTSKAGGQSKASSIRLFQVRSNAAGNTRAIEVRWSTIVDQRTCPYCGDGGGKKLNVFIYLVYFIPIKVDPVASNLNSNDVFILVNPSNSVLWVGQGASDVEKYGAKQLAEILGVQVSEVTEGEEGGMATD